MALEKGQLAQLLKLTLDRVQILDDVTLNKEQMQSHSIALQEQVCHTAVIYFRTTQTRSVTALPTTIANPGSYPTSLRRRLVNAFVWAGALLVLWLLLLFSGLTSSYDRWQNCVAG